MPARKEMEDWEKVSWCSQRFLGNVFEVISRTFARAIYGPGKISNGYEISNTGPEWHACCFDIASASFKPWGNLQGIDKSADIVQGA